MKRWLRQRWKKKRGQAIVLGSVGLFIMVLGVISTLNIGQAVSERIRLQNAADAAAYSLAAEEARLFNFFAFTNRAQVAHYSAAMTIQSYISYLTYVGGIMGTLRDLIWDAASVYQCVCDLEIEYPPISPIYCALAEVFAWVGNIFGFVLSGYEELLNESDEQAAELIEAMNVFNRAIWRAQIQQGLMINILLTSGAYPFVEDNDELVPFGVINGFNALFNQLEFAQVFDRGAGLNFSLIGIVDNPSDIWAPRINDEGNTEDDVQVARQVMTEIANGSRWGAGGSSEDHFVTDRSDSSPEPFAGFAWLIGDRHGQTRMVSGDDNGTIEVGDDIEIEEIRDDSEYFTGSVIASDDYIHSIGMGITVSFEGYQESEDIGAAVLSDIDGGVHYGYLHSDDSMWESGMRRLPPDISALMSPIVWEAACVHSCCSETETTFPDDTNDDYDDHEEEIHVWEGVSAYPKFNPHPDETYDYHQPSTWIFLNLPPENFNRFGSEGQQPWSMDFSMQFGSRTVTLDTTPGVGDSALFDFLEGLNAVSRGQAYYHRPRPRGENEESNWQEHPNFFNPFWRARLAPVGQKLFQLYNRWVSRELHVEEGSNPILAGGANFVRNFLGDAFFHAVTSVMTH